MKAVNRLTLKASLIDSITFAKFGQHLAPNWKTAKNEICKVAEQKTNIPNSQYLNLIGLIYRDNNLEEEFWGIIKKFKAEKYL
jgi:hypothetical protein